MSNNSGFIRLDADLGIVSLDEKAGRLLDISPGTLLGRRFDEIADLANLGNLIKNGISFSSQVIVVGSRRIACDYVPIVEDDLIVGGAVSLLQVLPEDCAAASDELSEILRSANAFMNFDHDGIILVDRSGIVVLVNQAFAKLFDTTPQAMIGKHVEQAYLNSQPSHLPTVMETGKAEIGITHYFNGKQVYASRFPLIKDGKVIGCMGKILFNDVREISRIANQLRAASKIPELRRNVAGEGPLFKYDITSIVGQSRKIAELKETLLRVAQKNSNVLLRGESGTGKNSSPTQFMPPATGVMHPS
jgi:PAS domain S-box-containing protein